MHKLIRNKRGVSAYYQIIEDIISRISSGEWPIGEKIPSELELVSLYGVSRMTLRKALDELAEEEIVFKERGVGTFAARQQVIRNQEYLLGLNEEMARQNRSLRSDIRILEVVKAPNMAETLGLPSSEVFLMQRLRYLDDIELLLDDSYISPEIADQIDLTDFGPHDSLFQRLESNGFLLLYADKEVHAINANSELVELLGYKKGAPIFQVKTVAFDQRGKPLLVSELHIRSDRYSIKISAKRR